MEADDDSLGEEKDHAVSETDRIDALRSGEWHPVDEDRRPRRRRRDRDGAAVVLDDEKRLAAERLVDVLVKRLGLARDFFSAPREGRAHANTREVVVPKDRER